MPSSLSLQMRVTLRGLRAFGEAFSALFEHAHRVGLAPSDRRVRVIRDIQYGADGRQAVDVYLPAKHTQGRTLPTFVFVHGGGWIACNRRMGSPLARTLAARGFAVITPGYRLLPTCTRNDQRKDVHDAMAWVVDAGAKRFDFDLSRLVVGGESAGAHLIMRTLQDWDTRWPRPRGAVGVYGLYDVGHLTDEAGPMFEPIRVALKQDDAFEEAVRDHSALRRLPWSDLPVLLLHGEDDDIAPVAQSHGMHAMLTEHGHEVRLRTFPGASHGFLYHSDPIRRKTASRAYRSLLRFLLEVTTRSTLRRSPARLPARSSEAL